MKNLLESCLNGTKEIPPRLIKRDIDIGRAEEHLAKAERNGMAMDVMYEKGFFDWSVVCAYYSMYLAALASLWILGLDARSHECTIIAFEAFYVKKMKSSSCLDIMKVIFIQQLFILCSNLHQKKMLILMMKTKGPIITLKKTILK